MRRSCVPELWPRCGPPRWWPKILKKKGNVFSYIRTHLSYRHYVFSNFRKKGGVWCTLIPMSGLMLLFLSEPNAALSASVTVMHIQQASKVPPLFAGGLPPVQRMMHLLMFSAPCLGRPMQALVQRRNPVLTFQMLFAALPQYQWFFLPNRSLSGLSFPDRCGINFPSWFSNHKPP